MNPLTPQAPLPRKSVASRGWSGFKAMPVLPKAVIVCTVSMFIYAAGRGVNPSPSPSPIPSPAPVGPHAGQFGQNRFKPQGANSAQSQQLTQLWAQHEKLANWARQCMADMNRVAADNPRRAANGQMPIQAPCSQSMYQATAQIALLETEISQLQGQSGSVCGITGYCPSSSSSATVAGTGSASYYNPNYNSGEEKVEQASREGILGQCLYNSADGDQAQLSCEGGDHYWQNVEHGGFNNSPDPPNNGYDYRRFDYSPQ